MIAQHYLFFRMVVITIIITSAIQIISHTVEAQKFVDDIHIDRDFELSNTPRTGQMTTVTIMVINQGDISYFNVKVSLFLNDDLLESRMISQITTTNWRKLVVFSYRSPYILPFSYDLRVVLNDHMYDNKDVYPGQATDVSVKIKPEPGLDLIALFLVEIFLGSYVVLRRWRRIRSKMPTDVEKDWAEIAPPTEPIVVEVIDAGSVEVVDADIERLIQDQITRLKKLKGRPEAVSKVNGNIGYIIEQVFVVHNDGRLIAQCARDECHTRDADLMSGMLIAIQGFIQDGLESGGVLESIKYGDNLLLMAPGEYVTLAAVVYGRPDDELKEILGDLVRHIQGVYAGIIELWDGDYSSLIGIESMIVRILEMTGQLSRDDVRDVAAKRGISIVSAIDFHRGYVRLKVAAINETDELMADTSIEVEYNSDLLRLESVEPVNLQLRGDRVTLGNIKPGERVTVAFNFDPQICQETHIDGSLTYFDSKGVRHLKQMKRRHADVVCPIFFTRENANTAMLRRLIKEKLHLNDLRIFRYSRRLSPDEALMLGKLALAGRDIQLVREYVVRGPPFESEVWYYGQTRVKGYEIVMRLGVVEEQRTLEFFAACTAMEPITGLLAEFRRELNHVLKERYVSDVRMEPERDEAVRLNLETRPLLIDRVGEGEIEPGEVT